MRRMARGRVVGLHHRGLARARLFALAGMLACAFGLTQAFVPSVVHGQSDGITLEVDARQVRAGDVIHLMVKATSTGGELGQVQLPDLRAFDVVGRQISRPMHFSFGFGSQRTQVSESHRLTLRALRMGKHKVGPASVRIDGKLWKSDVVEVEVLAGGAATEPDGDDGDGAGGQGVSDGGTPDPQAFQPQEGFFLRPVIEPKDPYMGEQMTYTLYLYTERGLRSAPEMIREPTFDGAWTHDLLPRNRTLRSVDQRVGNTLYRVFPIQRIAVFPLRAGELTVGPAKMRIDMGSLFDRMQGLLRRVEPESEALSIDVRPLPAVPAALQRATGSVAAGAKQALTTGKGVLVGDFSMQTEVDRTSLKTGDALTLTLKVKGHGRVVDEVFGDPVVDGLRVLEPTSKESLSKPRDRLVSAYERSWIMIPQQPGSMRIPGFSVLVFDPVAERYQRMETAGHELTVQGEPLQSSSDDAQGEDQGDDVEAGQEDAAEANSGARLPPWPAAQREMHRGWERRPAWWSKIRGQVEGDAGWRWMMSGLALPWLLALGLMWGLRRRIASSREKKRGDLGEALEAMNEARSAAREGNRAVAYGALERALHAGVQASVGVSSKGTSQRVLTKELEAAGLDASLVQALVRALDHVAFQRYAAPSLQNAGAGAKPEDSASSVAALETDVFETDARQVAELVQRLASESDPQVHARRRSDQGATPDLSKARKRRRGGTPS